MKRYEYLKKQLDNENNLKGITIITQRILD